ncbi:MAG: zinc metalloprotease HtpX [Candidatus Methanosuratincola sp.]|jgi:heat shock protein HtpX
MSSTLKTALLLALLTVGFVYIGRLLGGNAGMTVALVLALVMNFGAYWFSDKIVLGMYGAKEVSPESAPRLYRIVEDVARRAGLPTPKVYIVPSPTPNAFATGRDPEHGAVAVTQGILQLLEPHELEGVIAHEIGHIKNRDILISTIAATLAGAIGYIANMAQWALIFGGFNSRDSSNNGGLGGIGALLLIILAPIMALIIQLSISRAREFKADETAARVTGQPLSLASALKKISYGNARVPLDANPATAHMFIVNPLRGGLAGLFSTHPPVEERIERLEKMAYGL